LHLASNRKKGVRSGRLATILVLPVVIGDAMSFGPRTLLILIAVIIFAVAAIGFDVRGISLTALGLAFFAASWLVPEGVFARRP
jgi:hypothetical protein